MAAISSLYELLEPSLQPLTRQSRAVPGMVKLLCSLHFLAAGSFQRVRGFTGGVHSPPFHGALARSWTPSWNAVKRHFYGVSGIPNVLGAIDCTHVALNPPPQDREHIFRNRKGYHSLNVQVVCDGCMNILSIVSGFPGSSHDAYTLRQSGLYHSFETGQMPHGWLLGKYLCQLSSTTCPHLLSRSVIEQTFGILKSRFRCLDKSGGSLMYSPTKVANIVAACAVLHNLANRHGLPGDVAEDLEDPIHPQDPVRGADARGSEVQGQIITNYFSCKYLQSLIPYTRNTKQL
uniref:DDE Tnp4 domain-containing protein n=1 Tax=Xenopus tropicalis TaxID=8364 RepID=A0A803JC58_XENTR